MRIILVFILTIFVCACGPDPQDKFKGPVPQVNIEEMLIEKQKAILVKDSLIIEKFIEYKAWSMISSGTGLRYEIYETAIGDSIQSGEQVTLGYVLMDLSEDTLYSSETSGVMNLVVDYSRAEVGLHELLKGMRRGESARAIMPAHLAHGLVGDDYKIPPMTTLVFDIKVYK